MKDKAKKNESKKKSFYFEDYDESKIIGNNKNANIAKVSLNRVTFLFLVFFSLVLIFSIKIFHLSLSPEKNFFSRNINLSLIKERGDIVDRNGIIIARSIDIYSAGIRPKLVKNKKKFLINLRLIFPELDSNKIKEGDDIFLDYVKDAEELYITVNKKEVKK